MRQINTVTSIRRGVLGQLRSGSGVTASDGVYEAKACASCAASGVKSAGTEGSPLAVEILGEAE